MSNVCDLGSYQISVNKNGTIIIRHHTGPDKYVTKTFRPYVMNLILDLLFNLETEFKESEGWKQKS